MVSETISNVTQVAKIISYVSVFSSENQLIPMNYQHTSINNIVSDYNKN